MKAVLVLLGLVALVSATVYFEDDFSSGTFDKWVVSEHKAESERGEWALEAPKSAVDENDKGLKTTQDARFYQISVALDKSFSNKDKDLVIQYSVMHEQNIDCGGGYVKLLPTGLDQQDFHGDSKYSIMFGPDICGSTKNCHVIFNYKDKNHLLNKKITAKSDVDRHLYTLIVKPDQTYEVLIDNASVQKGNLVDDWSFLPPKQIKDPNQSKPDDWVDQAKIPDPEDVKPEGWDDIPAEIVDPEAEKPEDWDDELDGEWEAPMIPNPDYKGEWKPRMIDNPDYKGPWVHPMIDNPDYYEDSEIYAYDDHSFLGIEVWQVKSGTIFDDFLVTDDVEYAKSKAEKFLEKQKQEIENRTAAAKAEAPEAEDGDAGLDDFDLDNLDQLDLEGLDDEAVHDEL